MPQHPYDPGQGNGGARDPDEYANPADPLRDQHIAFPEQPDLPQATGPAWTSAPALPPTAWAPTSRTWAPGSPGSSGSSPGPQAPRYPPPPDPASRRMPTPPARPANKRGKVLRTVVIVWICIAIFGSHDSSGSSSERTGSSIGVEVDSGDDSAELVPADTSVNALPTVVTSFRVEVSSGDRSVRLMTTTSAGQKAVVRDGVRPPWQIEVDPQDGYREAVSATEGQTTNGLVGPLVSGVVTAKASATSSRIQCRVYADESLVLVATGTGAVTCRVPATPR